MAKSPGMMRASLQRLSVFGKGYLIMPKAREYKVQKSRLHMIDQAIRSAQEKGKKINASILAEITEVNPRTIYRDIEYMRDMLGAPIEYDPAKKSFYYTEENYYLKAVPITEGELFSIALFDQFLEQYTNTPLEEALRKIFTKIIQCLPDNVSVDTSFLNSQVSFISDKIGNIELGVFTTIFNSLQKKRTMYFEYRSAGSSTSAPRKADPYHAICYKGTWYFIAYCYERKTLRMFSFSRVKKASLSKNNFIIPDDFDAHKFFDKEMGVWVSTQKPKTIELRFEKIAGTYVLERQWHSTQIIKENKDGSVTLKFTTTQIPEVLRWVLGQGHTVKVIRPLELAKMVKEESEKTIKLYTKPE